MKIQFSLILAGLLALAPVAAQAATGGVYADFSTTSLSTSGSPRFYGGTLGGFAEEKLKGSFDALNLGVDARFSIEHASQSYTAPPAPYGVNLGSLSTSYGYDTYVIGPEVSFNTHITPLRPYAEVLFGGAYASGSVSGGFTGYIPGENDAASQKYGLLSLVGGADITVLPHLAWRAVELNYGKFNGISSTTISSGLVLRLP